jgi:hypothetical protein
LRGLFTPNMAIVAVYGPQRADGSWGAQLAKRWTFRSYERSVPILAHPVARAGKYLVVIGSSQIGADVTAGYALTRRRGQCRANACAEWQGGVGWYVAANVATRAEADWMAAHRPEVTARSGSCGDQTSTCPRGGPPVCSSIVGVPNSQAEYSNICRAKVALREAMGDDLGIRSIWTQDGACP